MEFNEIDAFVTYVIAIGAVRAKDLIDSKHYFEFPNSTLPRDSFQNQRMHKSDQLAFQKKQAKIKLNTKVYQRINKYELGGRT